MYLCTNFLIYIKMKNTTAKKTKSNGGGKLNDGLLKNWKKECPTPSGKLNAMGGYGKKTI